MAEPSAPVEPRADSPRPTRWGRGALTLVLAGALIASTLGIVATGTLEKTDSMEFCISCHVMRDIVYQEYKQSAHYQNSSGVRATCSDCHVPHGWAAHIARKIGASKFLYATLIGWVDTREEFEAKRAELAQTVWAYMRESDSRECRSCHSIEAMNLQDQTTRARTQHQESVKDGKTCIDCHNDGVAHKAVIVDTDESGSDDDGGFSLE